MRLDLSSRVREDLKIVWISLLVGRPEVCEAGPVAGEFEGMSPEWGSFLKFGSRNCVCDLRLLGRLQRFPAGLTGGCQVSLLGGAGHRLRQVGLPDLGCCAGHSDAKCRFVVHF